MWRTQHVAASASIRSRFFCDFKYKERIMGVLALTTPILMAAAGYSLVYLLLGGGLGGAILIFIVAKMLGR
jgi:hypothetical protein